MIRRRALRQSPAVTHGPAHDRWLLSYADLLTLLFAVFVVLFAFGTRTSEPIGEVSSAIHAGFDTLGVSPRPVEANLPRPSAAIQHPPALGFRTQMAEIENQLNEIFGDAISREEIELHETPEGLVISLSEFGFFNSGEANLLPGAAEKLGKASDILARYGVDVRVEGHSDDQPIHTALYASNWELSTARAMSVLSALVDGAGFPADKISLAAYSQYKPVADNSTLEGRAANRRVNLVVIAPHS